MSRLETLEHHGRASADAASAADSAFGVHDALDGEIVRLRLRRPIVAGSLVVVILVVGLLAWATFFSIAGAVNAAGVVRVENNSKVLKSRDGGVIREILVREGQRVQRGQVVIRLDPVQAQANADLYRSAYDGALANIARLQAESAGAPDIRFPADLMARTEQPDVAALLAAQAMLFQSRMTLYRTQAAVLRSQAAQIGTQIQGLRAQMAALDGQSALIADELSDVRDLSRLGYAPKSRLLALERSAVEMKGQRGSLTADTARAAQAMGDVRLQLAQLDDKRQTEAAEGLRQEQERLTEAGPKLRAITQSLDQTIVRAPVDGYVFNLTQFTEGGVVQPSEPLLQIVPVGKPMIITAHVHPADITALRVGLPVRVTLAAYNPRTTPPVDGRVAVVAADVTTDEATRESYYAVQIKVDPAALAKAGPGIRLSPGMPATVSIVTGSRTVLDYLVGPLIESMRTALTER